MCSSDVDRAEGQSVHDFIEGKFPAGGADVLDASFPDVYASATFSAVVFPADAAFNLLHLQSFFKSSAFVPSAAELAIINASSYPSSTSSYDVESALRLQNVHQLTQPIINNLLAVFQCVHVEEWSLLNEFLDGFDFVFEFPDLDPQVISNLAVIEDYGLFSSFLSTPSRISLSCLCHVSRCVKKRTELKKCDPAGEG